MDTNLDKPIFLTHKAKEIMKKAVPKYVEPNNRLEEGKKALKEFKPMKNYIVINGKKAELTEEQLKQLGIETEKKRNNPFNNKMEYGIEYYYIDAIDGVETTFFDDSEIDRDFIDNPNSFNNKDFANQVYLHELLNRKLLKYAYDHEAEDCEWSADDKSHYFIFFNYVLNKFDVNRHTMCKAGNCVYFSSEQVAKHAIEDVVKPFIKEHPEFVW